MNWLRNRLIGRYGRMDQLNIFLSIIFIVLALVRFVITIVMSVSLGGFGFTLSPVLRLIFALMFGLQMAAAAIVILRIFSRNIEARTKENYRFTTRLGDIRNKSDYRKKKKEANMEGKKLFKCPVCRKVVRVPKGRGKIEITCPNCKSKFIRKT